MPPARRGWHQQPARDDRGLGPRHGSAGPSGDRLAGHPHQADAVARIGDLDRFRAKTGLPVSTYSSALKLR